VCPAGNNGYLAEAFSSGVDDIVTLPDFADAEVERALGTQLAFTLEKAVTRKRKKDVDSPTGTSKLICVLGLKGGTGKTLTAVNLGAALADEGHSVTLVDLDLQFGDLALAMGLPPARTMYDLVRSGGSLDSEKLRDFTVEHSSGARVLLAPVRPDQASEVTVPMVREMLRLLRENNDYVIVDTPPNFTPEVIAAVDASTDVILVSMRDTLALKNTKLGLETLDRMKYDRGNVRIVLNRANSNVGIARQDILAILGSEVDVLVPSHRDVTRSVNHGVPISLQRGSAAGKAFRALAELYSAGNEKVKPHPAPTGPTESVEVAVPTPVKRRRLFGRTA
jgi:pilus assembly protein CpaE